MKLSQTRLREIIQEEVARMKEDERSPEGRVYDYVKAKTKYTGDDLITAANSVIAQIKRNAQEAGTSTLGELGPLPKIVTIKMMQAAMRVLNEEELEEVDTSGMEVIAAISPELGDMTAKKLKAAGLVGDIQDALTNERITDKQKSDLIDQALKAYNS